MALGWHKYHPLIEMLGAHRFKMGEITSKFLHEIRSFNSKKVDSENSPIIGKEEIINKVLEAKKVSELLNSDSGSSQISSDSK